MMDVEGFVPEYLTPRDLAKDIERRKEMLDINKKSKAAKVYKKYNALIKKGIPRERAFKMAAGKKYNRKG